MSYAHEIDLDINLILSQKVNLSAVERRCETIIKRRSVKKKKQVEWLLKTIEFITTLAGDDTPGRVSRLCHKALNPVRKDILEDLDVSKNVSTAAVCVYPNLVKEAKSSIGKNNIQIASVATGFPAGLIPENIKNSEIKAAIRDGATEIDVVINRNKVLTGNWKSLYNDIKNYKISMMAGADFIKTSTGKEPTNATLPVSLVMIRAIRDFYDLTKKKIGFKAAGGISKSKQAINYLILMKEELDDDWLTKNLFRIGASSLLADVERQLEHLSTGSYSAENRHPIV